MEGKSRRVSITTIVGGRTSARRKPYRNDSRKPSNKAITKELKHARTKCNYNAKIERKQAPDV
jgi:hypothetical protein